VLWQAFQLGACSSLAAPAAPAAATATPILTEDDQLTKQVAQPHPPPQPQPLAMDDGSCYGEARPSSPSRSAAAAKKRKLEPRTEPKPAPLTAEEALAAAEREGLTLRQNRNAAGYRGVTAEEQGTRYTARVSRNGAQVRIGTFGTAEEAALAYARSAEAQAIAAKLRPPPLTAEEALAAAEREGLTLKQSRNAGGYRGVTAEEQGTRYAANVWRNGAKVRIGTFDTAEEAALAYARSAEVQAQEAKIEVNPNL
jgi:hypothetical protein